ncbi:ribonuclease HII [Bacteroidia bacterium]|nr:ribonuclease HII [Bacteroidia bacterium]
MLNYFTENLIEAGCDEAGRGPLAGDVFAAAVVFPKDYHNEKINDSKKLTAKQRFELRSEIEKSALTFAVATVSAREIDEINILNASILAMHRAIDALKITPELLLIDGNKFKDYKDIPHHCIVKGDSKYLAIAAASILAKTYRDDYMTELSKSYPQYGWDKNAGYPTKQHYLAIREYGITVHHRKSFRLF